MPALPAVEAGARRTQPPARCRDWCFATRHRVEHTVASLRFAHDAADHARLRRTAGARFARSRSLNVHVPVIIDGVR